MSEKKKTSKKKGSLTGEERKHLLKCRLIRLFKPVKRNKIVFSQFGGKGYGCNPRAICDEFLRRNGNYDLVWILGKSKSREEAGIPDGVRTGRNLIVVTAPGPGSGKMATCLSQLYFEKPSIWVVMTSSDV